MSHSRNVADFRDRVRQVFDAVPRVKATLDRNLNVRSSESADPAAAAEAAVARRTHLLECHARNYVIDHLLSALNWQLYPELEAGPYLSANVVIEQGPDFGAASRTTEGAEGEKRKRMDYLGYDRETDRPLMIVEAKRFSLKMPLGVALIKAPSLHPAIAYFNEYLEHTRQAESIEKDQALTVEWQKYLSQIRAYARQVFTNSGTWPKRVVASNGEWLVVFMDPASSFGHTDDIVHPDSVLVFDSHASILESADLIWSALEYGSLAAAQVDCRPADVAFLIDPAHISSCMFGLIVLHGRSPAIHQRRPSLRVSPVVILRSQGVSFLRISEPPWEMEVPDDPDEMATHLQEVTTEAHLLKLKVENVLGSGVLPLVSIEEHMSDGEGFARLPAVIPIEWPCESPGETAVLAVTGAVTHFVSVSAGYTNCPHHHHSQAFHANVAQLDRPILRKSGAEPRSYFVDGSEYHCTHKDVYRPKGNQVTAENRERCGPRSARDGGAFCELWSIEEMLCCRACVYQNVCTAATVLSVMPCPAPLVQVGIPASGDAGSA